jgi:hypothetical protein
MSLDIKMRGKTRHGMNFGPSSSYRQWNFILPRKAYTCLETLIRKKGREEIEKRIDKAGGVSLVWGAARAVAAIARALDRFLSPHRQFKSGPFFRSVVNLTSVPRYDVVRGLLIVLRRFFPDEHIMWDRLDVRLIDIWESFRDNHSFRPKAHRGRHGGYEDQYHGLRDTKDIEDTEE